MYNQCHVKLYVNRIQQKTDSMSNKQAIYFRLIDSKEEFLFLLVDDLLIEHGISKHL